MEATGNLIPTHCPRARYSHAHPTHTHAGPASTAQSPMHITQMALPSQLISAWYELLSRGSGA